MKFSNVPQANIHLNAIQKNLALIKKHSPNSRAMVVVKADAYGHGAVKVCQSLSHADAFAVARVSEAVDLRDADINKQIVVMEGFLDAAELEICDQLDLTPTLHSDYQLDLLGERPVWLKMNTGMNRLGFSFEKNTPEWRSFTEKIKTKNILGIMSHLANAEQQSNSANAAQIERFNDLIESLGMDLPCAMANSSAILDFPNQYEWVRPGIMMYGGSARGVFDDRLEAGMTLTAPVIAINQIKAGESVGYGGLWIAPEDCRVAVVGLGYGDGYPREVSIDTPVLVNGDRRSLVGRISMDMSCVKLETRDQVEIGDRITFWGPGLPIDEIAACAGTLSYTLMTGLTPRVQRSYDS